VHAFTPAEACLGLAVHSPVWGGQVGGAQRIEAHRLSGQSELDSGSSAARQRSVARRERG
jgi:hypothetical protein